MIINRQRNTKSCISLLIYKKEAGKSLITRCFLKLAGSGWFPDEEGIKTDGKVSKILMLMSGWFPDEEGIKTELFRPE